MYTRHLTHIETLGWDIGGVIGRVVIVG